MEISTGSEGRPSALPMPEVDGVHHEVEQCCRETVEELAKNNPIMVCQSCKRLIKCFQDLNAFRNYLIFCRSRSREVHASQHAGYYVAVFRAYQKPR